MEQKLDLDRVVRQRIRALRLGKGWTLDALARQCHLSPSNLSRIETGERRIALDQLVPIARALGTTLDELIETEDAEDVVIRPHPCTVDHATIWLLSNERAVNGVTVAKMRISPERPTGQEDMAVHPGRDWFTVISGTARLHLGDRVILVQEGESAEFSTTTPHVIGAQSGPVEILTIVTNDGERSHLPAGTVPRAAD
ncbi:helix-turn-helix domain-containing protein [Microbacterium sp. CIAB417]|uniref:helix-turn-helix domain-containing protein n=1 Tax=Microbacterium sp. CIAB417 TaxID=2860287 RepID=UPI001FAD04EA|nr:XRE family transcriptional regulator [Microbacterium sp. CIAB417]